MHAIVQRGFGDPETLRYEEVDDPTPRPGQVRIAVGAAGVHLIDARLRVGMAFGPYPPPALPMTPGREVAGVVDHVGSDVDRNWLGRRVVASLGAASGGYAELAVADIDSLHELPSGVSFIDAVATVGTGRTAVLILAAAAITSADVVIITAAAGGIGSLLTRAAHDQHSFVVGLAGGPPKVAIVELLGADLAVDYSSSRWVDDVRAGLGERKATIALDGVGGPLGLDVLNLIGDGGRMVVFGAASGGRMLSAADSTTVTITPVVGPGAGVTPQTLDRLTVVALDDLAAGRLAPLVHPPFHLADAAGAQRALETRQTTGKVVLVP